MTDGGEDMDKACAKALGQGRTWRFSGTKGRSARPKQGERGERRVQDSTPQALWVMAS